MAKAKPIMTKRTGPDYGIDAPGVVRGLSIGGMVMVLAGTIGPHLPGVPLGLVGPLRGFSISGTFMILVASFMVWSSRSGKIKLAQWIIKQHAWKGSEKVLDVGCGRGLALLHAAQQLTKGGTARGVDLWSEKDLGGNSPERTLANAALLGLQSRVSVETGDARKLPYQDGEFDVVLSMTALHNIPDAAGRAEALRECARVLKPDGRLYLFDIMHPWSYLSVLRTTDLAEVRRVKRTFLWLLPGVVILARKPS